MIAPAISATTIPAESQRRRRPKIRPTPIAITRTGQNRQISSHSSHLTMPRFCSNRVTPAAMSNSAIIDTPGI